MLFKKTSKFLALFLCLVVIIGGGLTFTSSSSQMVAKAASTASLKKKRSAIQNEINNAEKKIESLKKQKKQTKEYMEVLGKKIDALQDKIDNLQDSIDDLQSQITTTQNSINKTEAEIDQVQKEIDQKQAEFDKTYNDYCQRLRAMYISGNVSNLEVLLESSDLSTILTRSQMVESVSKKDTKTLNDLMKKMEEIEKSKAALEKKRASLKAQRKKLKDAKAELDEDMSDLKSSKSKLDADAAEYNAKLKELNSKESEIQEAIETDQKKLNQVNAQIAAAYSSSSSSRGSGTYIQGNGQLAYPTSYRSVSAGFPYYSSGRYHSGVDFPCPRGTAVHAAGDGTVILARALNYSYGHYIIIDHGNGLSTLYAHNTSFAVSVGQKVSKGQTIAYSGSTGNSTGPHCHFEVRVNGSAVQPLNYL